MYSFVFHFACTTYCDVIYWGSKNFTIERALQEASVIRIGSLLLRIFWLLYWLYTLMGTLRVDRTEEGEENHGIVTLKSWQGVLSPRFCALLRTERWWTVITDASIITPLWLTERVKGWGVMMILFNKLCSITCLSMFAFFTNVCIFYPFLRNNLISIVKTNGHRKWLASLTNGKGIIDTLECIDQSL